MFASLVFAPDGALDTVVGTDVVRRLDVPTGRVRGEIRWPGAQILRIAEAPGDRIAVLVRGSNVVRLYSFADGGHAELAFPAQADGLPVGTVSCVAFSRDGGRVAVGTWIGMVYVRDLATGATRAFKAHAGVLWSIGFLAGDAGLLVTSGGSNGVAFWDLDSGECCYQTLQDEAPAGQVQLSTDGRTLGAATGRGIVALDLEYWQRHQAASLETTLAQRADASGADPARMAELRRWAAEVQARPWPRWR